MTRRPKSPGFADLLNSLQSGLETLATAAGDETLSIHRRRSLDTALRALSGRIDRLLTDLDPIRQPKSIFDPTNPEILGRIISLTMVAQEREKLSDVRRFYGSGIYAIYYTGKFKIYRPISSTETPIYVGKADPQSNSAKTPMEQGAKLAGRLNEHKRTIQKAASLDIDDFECRFLVVQSGYEAAAENYLIHLFKPLWNNETGILYGIGKHGDAATTRANKRSPWDTLHPGRGWAADSLEDKKSVAEIEAAVKSHLAATTIYKSMDVVLSEFVAELRQI